LREHYGPWLGLKSGGGVFYYDHPYPHKMPLIEERIKGRLLVTTLRDKEDTRESWIARGIHTQEDFEGQWNAWERYILPRAFVVSCWDRREERLANLAELLGRDLKTDWEPVNRRRV